VAELALALAQATFAAEVAAGATIDHEDIARACMCVCVGDGNDGGLIAMLQVAIHVLQPLRRKRQQCLLVCCATRNDGES
jgi:hypothetical protein